MNFVYDIVNTRATAASLLSITIIGRYIGIRLLGRVRGGSSPVNKKKCKKINIQGIKDMSYEQIYISCLKRYETMTN